MIQRIFVFRIVLVFCLLFAASGCASLVSNAAQNFSAQLQQTISEHDDPEMVKQAIPAYMLLTESFLVNDPDNVALLTASADLYTAYSSVFVEDLPRQQRLADRALGYASTAVCQHHKKYCQIRVQRFNEVETILAGASAEDVPVLFTLGAAWGNWIRFNSGDFNAIADIPKITALMQTVVRLDENYQKGGAHLYLGVLATLLPPAVGGKPEVGKAHFEQALALSGGDNLMVKVTYAQQYARMMFDQELHDRLLNEVLAQDAKAPGFTLSNWLAKQQAQQLLISGEDYF